MKITGKLPIEFGENFVEAIEHMFHSLKEQGIAEQHIHIEDTGLAFFVDKTNNRLSPLGCPCCLLGTVGQSQLGYPTINGKQLLGTDEMSDIPENISPEIKANLWFCPKCKIPILNLLPKFM